MRFKRALLASSALALFAGAQEAQAGMYLSVLGGANFHQSQSAVGTTDFRGGPSNPTTLFVHTDPDTGFFLGAAIGTHLDKWVKGLRAEIEMSYRRNDVKGQWTTISSDNDRSSGAIDANISNFAVMANVWYDFNIGSKAVPYIGGGVGWDRANINGAFLSDDGFDTSATFDHTTNGFAYQLGAGFNYPVADGVSVGVGYRFFHGPDIRFDPFFGGKLSDRIEVDLQNENHTAFVNLTIDIN